MKKVKYIIFNIFIVFNSLIFAANVYFLNDGPGYVYTNGQTFNSNEDGYAPVWYHIWADPTKYTVDEWGANFQDPNGNWSGWSQLSSGYGQHHCLKAGTWHVKGRVHVDHDIWGYSDYWMYTSFTLYFYVVDNYAPAVPQNFDVAVYYTGNNSHPKLIWTLNDEEDVRYADDGYLIERKITPGSGTFEQIASIDGLTNQYIDYYVNYAGSGPNLVEYKIRAKDVNNNYSNYTNTEAVNWGNAWKKGINNNEIIEYKLWQNYPNPFNPSTSISYILKKPGYVSLIVYNLLGKRVVELVNESQDKGYHNVNFNASNLPSGIYIYKLNAGEYTEFKKMQLIK